MPYPPRARRRRVPFSYGGGAPSPVTRVYADFGPSGKSVSFSSVTPDRIVMFVYPRAGNTGLPAGAPTVTNDRFQTIDFTYSGGALASIGSGFNGFIANIQLYSGSTLLLDEPVNNNDGLTYNGFSANDFRSFTFDGTRWLGVEQWNNPTVGANWTDNGNNSYTKGSTGFSRLGMDTASGNPIAANTRILVTADVTTVADAIRLFSSGGSGLATLSDGANSLEVTTESGGGLWFDDSEFMGTVANPSFRESLEVA